MTTTEPLDVGDPYNEIAIRTAEILAEARAASTPGDPGDSWVTATDLFPGRNRIPLGVALEYRRMGDRPVTEATEERFARLGFELEHLATTLGTVVHSIDLRARPDAEVVEALRTLLLERKVIFFRDQPIDEDTQVELGRCFGELDAFPFGPAGDNPYILKISHGPRSPGSENNWHSDVTWMEQPSLGSLALLLECPPVGGDTLFSDSYAAHLGLPPDVQQRLEHVNGINDYRIFINRGGRNGRVADDVVERIKAEIPFGVSHPVLRTHPETGRTALYLNGAFLRQDSLHDSRTGEPWDPEESTAMVRFLLTQHARPEYQCRFVWEKHSIAFWDNRAVQHYAASDYYPHRRVLRRVTIRGDRPHYDPDRAAATAPDLLPAI